MNIQTDATELLLQNGQPFIDGLIVSSHCETLQFESPAGVSLPPQYQCGQFEVDHALNSALAAHRKGTWRKAERRERKAMLLRWADLIEAQADHLALMDSVQTGRSLSNFTEDSIPKGIEALRWFAELTDKVDDRSLSEGHPISYLSIMRREPLGVVVAIIPWNDPLVVYMWKVACALVCGNAVIVKASEFAHYSLSLVTRLAIEAGLPAGQLQLLTGDGRTGALLVRHPITDCISFTGSSATGKWIASEASRERLKRVSLECGGKSAFIVSERSHKIQEAAACLAKNIFYNQGQICSAPSRAYVQSSVANSFISAVAHEAKRYEPSHPITGQTGVGYMISREAVVRVNRAIDAAAKRGYLPAYQGVAEDTDRSIAPTIFIDLPEHDPLMREELFGPILIINRVENMQAALDRANDSVFGLAAGIWTDDLEQAMWLSSALEAGTVHVNSYGEDGNQIPFGGIKDSGLGKEKCLDALNSYSHVKSLCMRISREQIT
jgi:acyl-CoA reductase-like NAD-dependent aldehyde dehydrogenase